MKTLLSVLGCFAAVGLIVSFSIVLIEKYTVPTVLATVIGAVLMIVFVAVTTPRTHSSTTSH